MLKAFFLNEATKTLGHFSNSPQASYITATEFRYGTILVFHQWHFARVNIAFCGFLQRNLDIGSQGHLAANKLYFNE